VQDAVAHTLGLGEPVLTVEGQKLCPDHDVVGCQRELEPRGVSGKRVKRQVRRAAGLERLDAVLDLGVLAVKDLQGGDVRVLLVGDEALEAMPIEVGEAQLRAGVRALAAADQPGVRRPGAEVDLAG
jgi:hypothetical protein